MIRQNGYQSEGQSHPGPPPGHSARTVDRDAGCRRRAARFARRCHVSLPRADACDRILRPRLRQAHQDRRSRRRQAAGVLRAEQAPVHCAGAVARPTCCC